MKVKITLRYPFLGVKDTTQIMELEDDENLTMDEIHAAAMEYAMDMLLNEADIDYDILEEE